MARQERLELPTRCLEGSCSILTELLARFYGLVNRLFNRGDRIRTDDFLLPKQAR